MKVYLLIALAIVAVVLGVTFLTDYVTSIGRDRIVLKNGETVKRHIKSYTDGQLTVKGQYGTGRASAPMEAVRRITFAGTRSETGDTLVFNAGKRVECIIEEYRNGKLTIRLPNGRTKSGDIGSIRSFHCSVP